jgi:signal peptidase I
MSIKSTKEQQEFSEIEKMMRENPQKARTGVLAYFAELLKITLIALTIIIPVRYFLIKPFYVNGASMEPSYHDREYLIIDEISYRFNEPERGDVVVFRYPLDPKQFFIKRIVGLPGEHVVITNGEVRIANESKPEGFVLDEYYLASDSATRGQSDVVLEADEYFVLGDNRNASLDSRRFGPLARSQLIGRTWLRGWPPERIGVLDQANESNNQ